MVVRSFSAALVAVVFAGAGVAHAQHGTEAHGSPTPAAHAAAAKVAPAAEPSSSKESAEHAESAPAGKVTQVTRSRPGSSATKKAGDNGLNTALARIQERIATETGPHARAASSSAGPSPRHAAAAGTSKPAASRLVTLRWRLELHWPDELVEATAASELPARVALKW